jgi:hypothetical protein
VWPGQIDRTRARNGLGQNQPFRLLRFVGGVLSAWAAALALAGLTAGSASASAMSRLACSGTSYTWTGNGDASSWGNAKNWNPNGVPGACAADSVDIPIEANIAGMPTTTLASLTVDASAGSDGSLAGGTVTVTGHFELDGGALAATVDLPLGATGTIGGPGNSKGIGDSGIGLPGQINVSGTLELNDLSGTGGSLFLGGSGSRGVIDVASGATLTSTGTDNIDANCCDTQNGTLMNSGTVDVTDGTLGLFGAEFQQSSAVVVGSGALLDDDAPVTLASGSSYSGMGRMLLDLNARPAMLAGNISLGSGFNLELGPQACTEGTSTISGAGSFDFTGGNLTGHLTIAKGTTMHVTGPAGKDLSTFSCNTVTISGGDFTTQSKVHFGSVASPSVVYVSATKLKAVAPAHAAGTVQVKVTNALGSSLSSAASAYRY